MPLRYRSIGIPLLLRAAMMGLLILAAGCNSSDGFRCPSVGPEGLKPDILAQVNQFRADGRDCGTESFPPAPPLQWNDLLAQAAMRHASDMAANQFVGHTGSDGSSPATRIRDQGYTFSAFAENILTGANSSQEAANSWIGSADHCANIMNPNFTEIGVAAVKGDQVDCETLYWAMELARPAGT